MNEFFILTHCNPTNGEETYLNPARQFVKGKQNAMQFKDRSAAMVYMDDPANQYVLDCYLDSRGTIVTRIVYYA